MILRRIIDHFRNQEWTAIALDFAIVVLGVFLGLQVNNWNASRLEASLERDVLANIVVDLQADARNLQAGINMADVNIGAASYALDKAGLKPVSTVGLAVDNAIVPGMQMEVSIQTEVSDEDAQHLWSLAVVRFHPVQSSTAFDTLMSTGRLDLIRDQDIVAKLQAYRVQWEDVETSQDTTYRPFRNQAIFVGQKQGLSPFIEMPEEDYVALVRDTPELAGALRTLMEYSVLHRQQLYVTRESTLALLHTLGAEEAP